MRVLFLSDRLSLQGGADHHLRQVMEAVAVAGAEVVLACGRIESGVLPPKGVRLERVRGLASMTRSESRLMALDGLVASADIVHIHNVMNPAALERAAAGGRTVVTIQDHRTFCPGAGKTLPGGDRCVEKFSVDVCRQCLEDHAYLAKMVTLTNDRLQAIRHSRVVVLSNYMAEELARVGIEGAEVLPPWVEVASSKRRDAGHGFVIGGRLVKHKAVLDAVEAWRRSASGQPLVVAGEGPLEAEIDGAEHRGWLDQEELRTLLSSARALLFPGRWQEPFGILAVQALACGTPVITSASGGADDWADAGVIRCAPGDLEEMAARIGELAASPELALRLGEAGRQMVAERFSRRQIEPRLMALYRLPE